MKNMFIQTLICAVLAIPVFANAANPVSIEMKRTARAGTDGEKITVIGKALHAKAGAVVQTKKGVYYIKGKSDWGKWYGQKVKVTGTLEKITQKAEDLKNEKGEYVQGFSGTVYYIADAKVILVP